MKRTGYAIAAMLIVFTTIAIHLFARHAPMEAVPRSTAPTSVPTSQPSVIVKIENFHFSPKELEIAVGTTVTWQNADDVPHTATSKDDPQTFDSSTLDTDDQFSFTFKNPGKYRYYCKVHPHMTGVITVR